MNNFYRKNVYGQPLPLSPSANTKRIIYFSFFTAEILHELCTFKRIAGSSRQRVHRTLEFADILVALPVHPLSYFICHICNDLIASLVDDTA